MRKFELAEINMIPFLFFSTYQKELEVNWEEESIKSYTQESIKRRVYTDDGDKYYFFDSNHMKQFVPYEETVEYDSVLYFDEKKLHLQNESYFLKANKYWIIFLKLFPLLLVALLSFRFPIDFQNLFNINSGNVKFIDIFDVPMIFAFPIACFLVYVGYRFRESRALVVILLIVVYFGLFFLAVKLPFFVHLNRHLLTAIFFVWAVFNLYATYSREDFDDYYGIISYHDFENQKTKHNFFIRKILVSKYYMRIIQ